MTQSTHPHLSLAALLLGLGCSDSSSEQTSTTPEDELLILPGADNSPAQGPSSAALGGVVADPSQGPSSVGDSAPLTYDAVSGQWDVPNDADFTGPPLDVSDGPASADECPTASISASNAGASVEQICFFSADDPDTPAARIDQVVESVDGNAWVRVRLTLNPNFVDNSFGETAVGWEGDAQADGKKKKRQGHTFKDLVGSDHAEMKITDAGGDVVLHFKLDYLSEDSNSASGYSSLGVLGGDGKMLEGDPAWIVAVATSLDRNLNACGLGAYVDDSPMPAVEGSASAEEPDWDYRVVYEVWVSGEAFGAEGFGDAFIEFVHASPSKAGKSSVDVTPGDCPPQTGEPPTAEDPPPEMSEGPPEDAGVVSPAPVGIAR